MTGGPASLELASLASASAARTVKAPSGFLREASAELSTRYVKVEGCWNESATCRSIANQISPGERTMWSPRLQWPRQREVVSDRALPAMFITTPSSFACQAKQSLGARSASHWALHARSVRHPYYLTTSGSVRTVNCEVEMRISVGS